MFSYHENKHCKFVSKCICQSFFMKTFCLLYYLFLKLITNYYQSYFMLKLSNYSRVNFLKKVKFYVPFDLCRIMTQKYPLVAWKWSLQANTSKIYIRWRIRLIRVLAMKPPQNSMLAYLPELGKKVPSGYTLGWCNARGFKPSKMSSSKLWSFYEILV